jgi:hypothetical protein
VHPGFFTGFALGPDVDGASRIFAHQHGSEPGLLSRGSQPSHLLRHFGANRLGDGGSIE